MPQNPLPFAILSALYSSWVLAVDTMTALECVHQGLGPHMTNILDFLINPGISFSILQCMLSILSPCMPHDIVNLPSLWACCQEQALLSPDSHSWRMKLCLTHNANHQQGKFCGGVIYPSPMIHHACKFFLCVCWTTYISYVYFVP